MKSNSFDVIIIGAGVVGCSIAFALAKRGIRTVNFDFLPASGYGSTSHSSAVVRPMYSHVTSCAIAHESRSLWLNWGDFLQVPDDRGWAKYTESGSLLLLREGEEQQYQAALDAMKTVGVEFDRIGRSKLKELHPGICLDSFGPAKRLDDPLFGHNTSGRITGAIRVPAAGYVSDPQLASHNLQVAAESKGAQFRFNCKVSRIIRSEAGVKGLQLSDGSEVLATTVVNAAGPYSSRVNDLAGIREQLRISTTAQRHEVVYLPTPEHHFSRSSHVVFDIDSGVYLRPDGVDMLIGSADPDCDPAVLVDPDHCDSNLSDQWTLQAYRAAQRFPEFGISNTARGTVGIYDVSDDWVPIYDKTDLSGFYLAIGTSGNQFKNAPLVGEIMAQIIDMDREGCDHDKTPATLSLASLGREVSLGFYSRLRKKNPTHSVMA